MYAAGYLATIEADAKLGGSDGPLHDAPVVAAADSVEISHVRRVTVTEATDIGITLLFDPEHNLDERVIKEQFQP